MEARFKLRKKNETVSYVQLVINSEKERFITSTNLTIERKHWGKGFPLKINATKELRSTLEKVKYRTDIFIQDSIVNIKRKPTKHEWNEFFHELKGGANPTTLIADLGIIYLEQRRPLVKENTYDTINLHVTSFSLFLKKRSLTDINKAALSNYITFLLNKNFEISTTNGYIKNIKAFLNWLHDNDYTDINFSKYLKKEKQLPKPIIALLEDELTILEGGEQNIEWVESVRNVFLFACYTGLRYSDVKNFTKKNVNGNDIVIRQQKTGNTVKIPIIPQTKKILEKYNYTLPVISEQKTNKCLKELFQSLDLNREVLTTSQTTQSGVVDIHKKLSEAITFHIARKSFITIALKKGLNTIMVMEISGHRKFSEFQKYISFASEDLSVEMQKFSER